MAADDLITFDELRARLVEVDDRRTTAEQELRALQSREGHLDELEHDRDVLLDHLTNIAPEALEALAQKSATSSIRCSGSRSAPTWTVLWR